MNLEEVTLQRGKHARRADGVCLLEAIAWFAGEPHTDRPVCVCPVIAAFGRSWNDDLLNCEERQRLLRPLIPLMVGTVSTHAVAVQRSYLVIDWLVRVHAPAWLQLVQNLTAHAERLRGLPEINDAESWSLAKSTLIEAAKMPPVLVAASDAAIAVVRAAAGRVAWDVVRVVSYTNATSWELVYTTSWKAAATALEAGIDLKPTVQALQESAVDLLKRMCACGKPDKQ